MKHLLGSTLLWRKLLLLTLPVVLGLACGLGSATGGETPTTGPISPTETATAGVDPTETPTPGPTGSSQSDTLTPQTPDSPTVVAPDETPTTTLESSPTSMPATATSTLGIIAGQITFRDRTGNIQPESNATVELVGSTNSNYFSANTNSEGRYTLTNIPPGLYWLLARSPTGSSNLQEIQVTTGEPATVDLIIFTGYPTVSMRPAGGRVRVAGQPVAGAQVWRFGGLIESDKRAVSDQSGYFSFPYVADTPVIAISGERWTVTTLQPDAVIDIELDRTGPHPSPPDGPVVTPVPVGGDVVIVVPTLPPVLPPQLTPEIQIILPTPPVIIQPTLDRSEISTAVPIQPTLAQPVLEPTVTPIPTPTPLPPVPTACGQAKDKIDYGPVSVGSTVILGRHEPVEGTDIWDQEMDKYLKQKATITKLDGVDKVGCPVVRIDLDEGRWQWRIRALSLIEP